jgi:riboflavin kinase/FMN adenylyltransferase
MIVFHDPAEVPHGFGPTVVAIGKFDGVHLGHRAMLARALTDAAASGAKVVAVTFDRNPLRVLRPERCPLDVIGVHQKLRLLAETGVDATLLLRFDERLAALAAEEFVEHVLVDRLGVRTVLVGHDFRFGRGGTGDPALLSELGVRHGFTVDLIDDVKSTGDGERVSSTRIREALAEGDVRMAATLLGRMPSVRGEVVHGQERGRELGFPTANLAADLEGFVPADGVYAGWLTDDSGIRRPAAISVGTNPTFDDVARRQVEAYVLDETDLDLYGQVVDVEFAAYLRGMVAFDDIDTLKVQMADDVERARSTLA